jgi:hypothetical protein
MGFVEETLDGRVLDGAVHSLGLPVGPGMLGRAAYPVVCAISSAARCGRRGSCSGQIRLWATVAAL